jgi:hypothetical protein
MGALEPVAANHRMALALGLCALILAMWGASARAVILPAVTIDGPSEEIVGFGGVAMAEDGTGGAVYLKRVEGVAHVFVSRFREGHWLAPQRVDTEEPFAASWPRIGAGDGGQLVVVWATPFATENGRPVEELLSSTLGTGSTLFGPAIIVDPNIRNGTGTSPDLAMSSTGQADVVYRVVNEGPGQVVPLLRPGDVVEDVRVAHYNGERWSLLGAINRNSGISMRPPTPANAPRVAIGPTGGAVVVWQEPDIEGVARIWARRLFGHSVDYVLPVSATNLAGAPIGIDADAPSVAISKLGEAAVAYRQATGPGSPLAGPRIFLNLLPDGESTSGAQFAGASVADSLVSGGAAAAVGPPSIDIDEKQDLRLVYDSNGTPRVVQGNDRGLAGTLSLGPGFSGAEPSSVSVMNPTGGGVSAWSSTDGSGHPAVAVREDFPSGAVQTGLVGDAVGGPVSELTVARSGLGDGLVGFLQGPIGQAAVVATRVSAPPEQFVLSVPLKWVRPAAAQVSWQPAASADGPLTYQVVLDGRLLPTPAGAMALHLSPRGLGDGRHAIQVLATDADGQATLTSPSALLIDGQPPVVSVARTGQRGVRVRVTDAASGVETRFVTVSFGDGAHAHGRASFRHFYGHAGTYQVVVQVRDKIGIQATVRRLVSVA